MLRATQDVVQIRRWSEAKGGRPCRDEANGRLDIALPGVPCDGARGRLGRVRGHLLRHRLRVPVRGRAGDPRGCSWDSPGDARAWMCAVPGDAAASP